MPGKNVNELQVAAGDVICAAPPGTANVVLATTPAAPWVDLGYADEDGVTLSDSPEESTIAAWQSADPVLVITTAIARTFAFNLMQWNPDVLKFALGASAVTPKPTEGDTMRPGQRSKYAVLMRWRDGGGFINQFYVPRGIVTGDVGAQLVRTDTANFALTLTSTPNAGEDAWRFTSNATPFIGVTVLLTAEGELLVENDDGSIAEPGVESEAV